jgi:cyclohexadieny/prephenate dehydrogenase
MTASPFKSIAIIGAGHIGASIARATALKLPDVQVSLYDASADVRERADKLGLGKIAATPADAVRDADLVVLCVPVGAMGAAAAEIVGALKAGAVLSDVGGVKGAVVEAVARQVPAHALFIPGHPIAGTEFSGPEAGVARLFENRWMILTPMDDPRSEYARAVANLETFWRELGANVAHMRPDRHDLVLAITSHLPHLIAFNIVATAEDLENVTESEVVKFSAGGFRDFTRIAASDPTMWRDVFLNNKEAVLEVLGRFTEDLAALQRAIRWSDGEVLFDTFTRARRVRREVIDAGQDTPAPSFGRSEEK